MNKIQLPQIDSVQNRTINILIAAISALGGIALFMGYLHTRKHSKLQQEVLELDRQIKEIELARKKNGK